ncbi:hypothetical protein [uncultured Paraglaciecola sp.]|mgnify:CR=1 FL=1|jgi:hypothetical protein|uniref:hypothetical protein n=1 Tax=uncultured Paraglaciecola sp. TaxID=1765024 RepID=UPI0025E1EE06|nr:hypothetical protein [uncultured Paraglaciecola sp.]
MADKKSAYNTKNQTPTATETVEISELDNLRNIVFGAAKNDIEQRINALEQQTQDNFKSMQLTIEKTLKVYKLPCARDSIN